MISSDFDFAFGHWQVRHRRLDRRLAGCTDWTEFSGTSSTRPILGGNGNVEDNVIDFPSGQYRAVAIRSFDPGSGTWAIWWLSTANPHVLDVPVIGRFDGDVGTFTAQDVHDGQPVLLRFVWSRTRSDSPRWEQALSADGGASWETNWVMDFHRS